MKKTIWVTGFKNCPDAVEYYSVSELIEPYDEQEEVISEYINKEVHLKAMEEQRIDDLKAIKELFKIAQGMNYTVDYYDVKRKIEDKDND